MKEFLSKYKAEKGEYTHTIIGGHGYVGGSYNVPMECRPELYQLLERVIFAEHGSVSLTEKPTENSVLRIDIDLRYPDGILEHQYTSEDIEQIAISYNEVLEQHLKTDKGALCAYVMERDAPYVDPKNKNSVKDGIHIMYPNIVLSKKLQNLVRKMVLPKLKERLTSLLERNNLTIENVVDSAIVDNNWLLYGCSKPNIKPYLLTRVLDDRCNDITDQLDVAPGGLIELMKVNLPDGVEPCQVKPEYELMINLIDTNKPGKRVPNPIDNQVDKLKVNMSGANAVDFKEVNELVRLLSAARSDDYQSWMKVGWCLKNMGNDMLDAWIKFSQKSRKYEEGICEREWNKMVSRADGLNIGSLHRWAKEDSPDGYAQLNSKKIDILIVKASSCTHQDVGHLIYELYKDQFVSTDGSKKSDKMWYEFGNHRWRECDGKVKLQEIMRKSLQDHCRLTVSRINKQAVETDDEELKNKLDKDNENINKLIFKLKDTTFKDKVFKECVYMFYDEHFSKKLDENIDLIGCENGVYDLRNGEFREGQPTDYITMSTGINYQAGDDDGPYDDGHPYIRAINHFFTQIQPIESVCTYLKILLGGCLYGRNINEQFYILEGVGGNGKSKLIELLETTLGPYASSIASNYFTQKRPQTQVANPDFAKIVYARIVTAQETEEGEKFNISTLKSLAGNDKITYRPLYGQCREVRPKFNILMAVNHLPTLPSDDVGTWRRVRLIRFLARFVDFPDPNNPYEHKKDLMLAEKFQRWRNAMLFSLFRWHKEFRNGNFHEPQEVLEATKAYQKQNDQYSEFLERFVVRRNGAFIQLEAVFNRMKEWWQENANGTRPDKKQFRAILEKRWGKVTSDHEHGQGWRNMELCDSIDMIQTPRLDSERVMYFGL